MWLLPLFGCLTYVASQHIHCDYGWTAFKHGCWIKKPFTATEYKTWFHAQAGCRAFRGKLAMFTDEAEYRDAVANVFNSKSSETVWVGLRRVITPNKENRSWEWPRYKEIPNPYMPNITVTDADWDNKPLLCGAVLNDPNVGIKLIAQDCVQQPATSYACFIPGGRSCSRNAEILNGTCRCKAGYIDVLDAPLSRGDLNFERGEKCVSANVTLTAKPTTASTVAPPAAPSAAPPSVAPPAAPSPAPPVAPPAPTPGIPDPIVAGPTAGAPLAASSPPSSGPIASSCNQVTKSMKTFFLMESTTDLGQDTFNKAAAFVSLLKSSLNNTVITKTMTYGAMGEFTDHDNAAPVFFQGKAADTMNALKQVHARMRPGTDHQVIYILTGNLPTATGNVDRDFQAFSQYIDMLQRTDPSLRLVFLALTSKLDPKAAELQKLLKNPADFIKLEGMLDARGVEQVLKQTCDSYV